MTHRFGCAMMALLIVCSWAVGRPAEASDDRPHAVIVVGTHHYSPHKTMPPFAETLQRHGFRTTVVLPDGNPEQRQGRVLPGLEALKDADVAVFFIRFLTLGEKEWSLIEHYFTSGKPVVGLRTSTYGFKYKPGHPRHNWNVDFGKRVLGTPYIIHMGSKTTCQIVENKSSNPVLRGIDSEPFTSDGMLYLVRLQPGCVPLVTGTGTGERQGTFMREAGTFHLSKKETAIMAWTWKNEWGGRVFGTSFGAPGDFERPEIVRILVNGVSWAAGTSIPAADEDIKGLNIGK